MIDVLKELIPNFSHFENREISDKGVVIGHEAVLLTKPRYPFAGGTAATLNEARRICTAEAIERAWFRRVASGSAELRSQFCYNEHPTTCGFAGGFEEHPTVFRAICEAVERWMWSQWIDQGMRVPQIQRLAGTALELKYASEFQKVFYFEIPISIERHLMPAFMPEDLVFRAVIAVSGSGIFPGSRMTTAADNSWEHPLLEAYRHKLIFSNELSKNKPFNIFDQRILEFGTNGLGQLKKIFGFKSAAWPKAKLRLLEKVAQGDQYHVWRALCSGFQGWEQGDQFRFIY